MMSRRSTRRALLGGVALAALLAGYDIKRATEAPTAKRIGAFGTKINAGNVTEVRATLAVQQYIRDIDGKFYLLPATSDTVIAVYWKCPVEGCTVPPPSLALGGKLGCPCCGAMYDGRQGTVLRGPTNRPADYAARPLDWMPVRITGGNVIVDTAAIAMRTGYDPLQAAPLG